MGWLGGACRSGHGGDCGEEDGGGGTPGILIGEGGVFLPGLAGGVSGSGWRCGLVRMGLPLRAWWGLRGRRWCCEGPG